MRSIEKFFCCIFSRLITYHIILLFLSFYVSVCYADLIPYANMKSLIGVINILIFSVGLVYLGCLLFAFIVYLLLLFFARFILKMYYIHYLKKDYVTLSIGHKKSLAWYLYADIFPWEYLIDKFNERLEYINGIKQLEDHLTNTSELKA